MCSFPRPMFDEKSNLKDLLDLKIQSLIVSKKKKFCFQLSIENK